MNVADISSPHTRTNYESNKWKCCKNWSDLMTKNIVQQLFRKLDWRRCNIQSFQKWNIGNLFRQRKSTKQIEKSQCDGLQQIKPNNLLVEKYKLKIASQVWIEKHCRRFMKHGQQTKNDEKWFMFGKFQTKNQSNRKNTKRKSDQFSAVYLNNIQNEITCICRRIVAFGLIVWMWGKICSGNIRSKSAWLWNFDRLKRLLFRRKQTSQFAI